MHWLIIHDLLPCLITSNTNNLLKKLNMDFVKIFCELNWALLYHGFISASST